jgi:hypothetical protein
MEFLVAALKANRKATYSELKAKAEEKKLPLFPIMYGRAQALLGIVKSAKRGTGKYAKGTAAKAASPAGNGGGGGSGGGKVGRPVDAGSKSAKIRSLLGSGMSAAEIAKKVGSTTALVYNIKSSLSKSPGGGSLGRGAAGAKAGKRGPGRPRTVNLPSASGLDGLSGILDAVRSADRERAHLRSVLEKIQAVIADALA